MRLRNKGYKVTTRKDALLESQKAILPPLGMPSMCDDDDVEAVPARAVAEEVEEAVGETAGLELDEVDLSEGRPKVAPVPAAERKPSALGNIDDDDDDEVDEDGAAEAGGAACCLCDWSVPEGAVLLT